MTALSVLTYNEKQMINDIEGYVHSVETAGTLDGPGIRFVVFLTGCPLRCLYCHNPDTRLMKNGTLRKASEIIHEAQEYSDYMGRTGGGITISGGEPLMQQAFVTEIFKGCKKAGIHTALDTSGCIGSSMSQDLLDATDLFLLDIKSFNTKIYKKLTNGRLESTLDFARILAAEGKKMWVRCVIVPDLTDNIDHLTALSEFLNELGNVERVEVLPFHKMGESKWKDLGYDYQLADVQPPSPVKIQLIRNIFTQNDLKTV